MAAFSPVANVRDRDYDLKKACGDGRHEMFHWRLFSFHEAKQSVLKFGFTMASKTDFKKEEITKERLCAVFCKTNGNRMYIKKIPAKPPPGLHDVRFGHHVQSNDWGSG